MDEDIAGVIHVADGSETALAIVKSNITFRENPALENEQGLQNINLMLLDIRESFVLVPFEFHCELPTGLDFDSSSLRKLDTRRRHNRRAGAFRVH